MNSSSSSSQQHANAGSNGYENPAYISYFYGRLLRDESEKILRARGCHTGLFLLRELVQEAGSYALSICHAHDVHHYKIDRQHEDGTVKIDKGRKFVGPIELIRHHQLEQDGLITRPLLPCERPRGTSPIYYLFVNDSEFNKLVDDEIEARVKRTNSPNNAAELRDARNRYRYSYERIVLKELHNTQPWFKAQCDRMRANELLAKSGLVNGKFLVRSSSESQPSSTSSSSLNDLFKISLCYNRDIKHYKIKHNGECARFSLDGGLEFDSIIQLVDYYHRCADGLADILRIPLLPMPSRLDPLWSSEAGAQNHRAPTDSIYNSNLMYEAILNQENGGRNRQSPPEYVDDEPQNSNDINDLTKVPETKRSLFVDEDNYAYESLSAYTIDARDLVVYDKLGSGCFGSVHRGTYKVRDRRGRVEQELPVAIKQLNIDTEESKQEIVKEAETMRALKHSYIIKFIGMCIDQSTSRLMIVLELAKLGPLHKYLRTHKEEMSMVKIVKLCYQVSLAMQYIAAKNLVHRDLAARNVLLASEDLAKVSDFGMSRNMDESLYYTTQTTGKWPLKWYPPEASQSGKFDEKSDVWSFGVTCWEATSYGGRPYQGIDISLLLRKLENGHRLEKPQMCPQEIFNIMYKCWHANKHKRPTFAEIVKELSLAIYDLYQLNV